MGSPYKAKNMRIYVVHGIGVEETTYTLGVVEGLVRELIKEGGVVPHYDSETGEHAIGTRHATFSITRWFKANTGQTDLLYDLHRNEIHFNLEGEIIPESGVPVTGSKITLSDCVIYTYSPRSGGANDILAEEARGEAKDWLKN